MWVYSRLRLRTFVFMKHVHYHYNFGESFTRRTVKEFDKIQPKECRSTENSILVGGGQNHCTFVLKQDVKYAASRTNLYQTPTVKRAATALVVKEQYISRDYLNTLFDFTVHMDLEDNVDTSSAKRMKIELSGEPSKNELFCTMLRKIVKVKELVIDTGYIDGDTPPLYSPYHPSKTDLYMYQEHFKRGVVACIGNDRCDDEDEDFKQEFLTMVCSGAWK